MRFASALTPFSTTPAPSPTPRRWESGIASLDTALGGGLAYGRVHEVYSAEIDDAAAAAGFALALTAGMTSGRVLWLRSRRQTRVAGMLQANGWAEMGALADHAVLGMAPDTMALLRAAVDALRCSSLGAVVVEGWGAMRELDLTASRRLALAAERSGVPLFLVRVDAQPSPSAAQTRWQVAAAPSHALPGNAPGLPCFDLDLLRQKSGPSGLNWRLEWNRDERTFRDAAHAGAVVSVPARKPLAGSGAGPLHQSARRAA